MIQRSLFYWDDNMLFLLLAMIAAMIFMHCIDILVESMNNKFEKNEQARYIKKVHDAYKHQDYLSQKEDN